MRGRFGMWLLAATGGCVDAVGFLTLGGLFVSHMSGNSAAFGAFFGQGDWSIGFPHFFAVPIFAAGIFVGSVWMAEKKSARRCSCLLVVEALLLALFAVLALRFGEPAKDTITYYAFCIIPLFAMGLQNATLHRIGESSFPTTYVTGVLDRFAQSLARRVRGKPDSETASTACLWLAYAAGATAGSAGMGFVGVGVLFVPVVALVLLASALLVWKA